MGICILIHLGYSLISQTIFMQNTQNLSESGSGEITLHLLDYWRVIRVRLPLIILVFLLVVITAGVATYLTPRQYSSSVTMQV